MGEKEDAPKNVKPKQADTRSSLSRQTGIQQQQEEIVKITKQIDGKLKKKVNAGLITPMHPSKQQTQHSTS